MIDAYNNARVISCACMQRVLQVQRYGVLVEMVVNSVFYLSDLYDYGHSIQYVSSV